MADIVSPQKRSQMMAGIKGKDTKPEILARKALHKRKLRYRLHQKGLPGKPDMVFAKYRTIVFVNGCFWHGHDCRLFKWPKSNPEFWRNKISANMNRDSQNIASLLNSDWQVLIIWECALRGTSEYEASSLFDKIASDIRSPKVGKLRDYAG